MNYTSDWRPTDTAYAALERICTRMSQEAKAHKAAYDAVLVECEAQRKRAERAERRAGPRNKWILAEWFWIGWLIGSITAILFSLFL